MPLLLIHFERFGPSHHARLESARHALECEVRGLEIAPEGSVHGGELARGEGVTRVFASGSAQDYSGLKIAREVTRVLDELKPDGIAISGFSSPDARACLKWCQENEARSILMSETREADGDRVWWKEFLKKKTVSQFDAALVGAKSHAAYLANFGLTKVHFGLNVVDHSSFVSVGEKAVPPVLLACSRFIPRKNLDALITGYLRSEIEKTWSLCLLGDGEEREGLEKIAGDVKSCAPWEDSGGQPAIYFPGVREAGEVPRFYAKASAFIHPALQEPWGLVINEAMAAGLPILSSRNVGAAEELVDHGINGWTFNPESVPEMAIYLEKLRRSTAAERAEMGLASQRILAERCPTSAFGKGMAKALFG